MEEGTYVWDMGMVVVNHVEDVFHFNSFVIRHIQQVEVDGLEKNNTINDTSRYHPNMRVSASIPVALIADPRTRSAWPCTSSRIRSSL